MTVSILGAVPAPALDGAMSVLLAITVAGSVFLAARLLLEKMGRRQLTRVERADLIAAEQGVLVEAPTLRERVEGWLLRNGYRGDLAPLILGVAVVYFLLLAVARQAGFPELVAALAGLPISVGVANLVFLRRQAKENARFAEQLTQFLDQFHDQLSAGSSVESAFNKVVPAMPNPLRGEMRSVLDAAAVDRSMVGPLTELAKRRPSPAMNLLLSAVEISEERGARIDKAIKLSAELLRSNQNLFDEAEAELSQSKAQFYGVAIGVACIAAWQMFIAPSPGDDDVFMRPGALFILAVLAGNYALGIVRIGRIFRKITAR